MIKRTFEWQAANGQTARIEVEYECRLDDTELDADGWKIKGGKELFEHGDLVAYLGDKVLGRCNMPMFWGLISTSRGKMIHGAEVGFRRDADAARYAEWIAQVKADGETAEAKAYKQAQAKQEAQRDLAEARETVRKAEAQKDIPTQAEARRRIKAYNDLYNEGGEGYVPRIITREEYDYAQEIIKKALS